MDHLDPFHQRGAGSNKETGSWMHAFSEFLVARPAVAVLRVDPGK